MRAKFTLGPDDLRALDHLVMRRQKVGLWTGMSVLFFAVVAAIQVYPALSDPAYQGSISRVISDLFFTIVMPMLLILAAWVWFWRRRYHRMEIESPGIYSPRVLELSEDGIRQEEEGGHTFARWNTVVDIVDTDRHLFFLTGPNRAFILPKNAINGEAQEAEFRDSAFNFWRASQ